MEKTVVRVDKIAFKLFIWFISTLGIPSEIYSYGTQMFTTIFGIGIGVWISGELWIPILHRLQLVSIYEYFEMRYKSKFPRRIITAIFVLKVSLRFKIYALLVTVHATA